MKTVSFALLLSISILSGCKKDNTSDVCTADYFPLKIGNSWQYKHKIAQVTRKVELNNLEYFEIQTNHIVADTIFSSFEAFYRKTEDGKVFMLSSTSDKYEKLYYNTCVLDNYSWTFKSLPDDYSEWQVTKTAHKGTFSINNQIIENCIQFNYDLKEAVDDEHSIILAPGIGLITSFSVWGIGDTLIRATINGTEYEIN